MQKLPQASVAPIARPVRLRHRSEFLAVAKGARAHMRLLSMQALPKSGPALPRFGLTVTKKEGGAVERNRMRRRLREALRIVAPLHARDNHDYVVIGRKQLLQARFADVLDELARAMARLHRQPGGGAGQARRAGQQPLKDRAQTP